MADPTPVTPAAEKAAKDLLHFWEVGRRSRRRVEKQKTKQEGYARHGTKADVQASEAEREKLDPLTLKNAWRVSELYTLTEIRKWCDLIRKQSARFGPSHLSRLLAIKDPVSRDELTRDAIIGGWSVTEVAKAVQAVAGRQKDGVGRKPKLPGTRPHLLVTLEGLCLRWEHWCDAAEKKLPATVKEDVKKLTEAIRELRQRIADMLPRSSEQK